MQLDIQKRRLSVRNKSVCDHQVLVVNWTHSIDVENKELGYSILPICKWLSMFWSQIGTRDRMLFVQNLRVFLCFSFRLEPSKILFAYLSNSLSFLEVKGSSLTCGARALAKHATRSSNRYWGRYDGSG